jgi:hypothetical protein
VILLTVTMKPIQIPQANTIKHQKGMREQQQSASPRCGGNYSASLDLYARRMRGMSDLLHRTGRLLVVVVTEAADG